MKIAFLAKNDCGKYSGGRLHVFTMAQALVSVGHEVDYYTNVKPIFYNIYSSYIEPKISWSLNIFLLLFNINKYNLLVVAPHLTSKKNWLFDAVIFYPIVRICKIIAKCKIAFIDFESPNWACKNISSRVPSQYYFSNKIIFAVTKQD